MTTDFTEGRMLIGGELVHAQDGEWIETDNPATEEIIGRVPSAKAADVARAVDAAATAQVRWQETDVLERARLIRAVAEKLRTHAPVILRTEVLDTGNTISKMKGDVEHAALALDFFAGVALEQKGETIPASADNLHLTMREPYGVVGRIVPFNHPVKFCAHAIAAPLIAGNTVVVKPPEQSPLSACQLAEICQEVLPPGVVNIVTGYGHTAGDAIVKHPAVRRIAFTGSVPTGQGILASAASVGIKHVSLELGGKNPLIAFADQDPDHIAQIAVGAMNFSWQGQSCGSASRLLLHESIHDRVVERILEIVAGLRLGDPLDPESQMGPLNSRRHYERVKGMVAAGIEDGARLAHGGKRPEGRQFERGYWLEPTVFTGVKRGMRIAQEEIFGPVLSIFKWKEEQQAIDLANSTDYGLTASIWTKDLRTAMRMVKAVKAGYVWVNGASAHYYGTPFGGTKNSGLGREEGLDELLSYTELKTLHVRF